jgi:hypothetical protein
MKWSNWHHTLRCARPRDGSRRLTACAKSLQPTHFCSHARLVSCSHLPSSLLHPPLWVPQDGQSVACCGHTRWHGGGGPRLHADLGSVSPAETDRLWINLCRHAQTPWMQLRGGVTYHYAGEVNINVIAKIYMYVLGGSSLFVHSHPVHPLVRARTHSLTVRTAARSFVHHPCQPHSFALLVVARR